MSAEVGYATLGIIPSFQGFERSLTKGAAGPMASAGRQGGDAFGQHAGQTAGKRFGSVFGKAAKAAMVGAAALGAGAIKIAADSISAASDLAESTNKVEQVFGRGSSEVLKFTKEAADALGQTNTQAREAAATFGIFGRVAGLTDRKNAKFAKRMTTLASDLASFNNTKPEQAIEAIGAALRGESEPIRAYGVLLDEATLKAEAMRIGLLKPVKDAAKIKTYQVQILDGQKKYNDAVKEYGKDSLEALKAEANLGTVRNRLQKATEGTIPPLTQQQKVLAAQSSILQQTKIQQGDFSRTSDQLANSQRRLTARWEDAKAELGTALLPMMEDFVGFLLDKGIPAVENFSTWFREEGIDALKDFSGEVKNAWGEVKDLAKWLDDLPGAAKLTALAGLVGGIGGAKLKFGRGALGSAGQALGIAKPIKVFETNPAALGGSGGAGGKPSKGGFLAGANTLTIATAAASALGILGTAGIKKLQDAVAPKASEKGIFGTPRNNGFDNLLTETGPQEYEKTLGKMNDAWNKVRGTSIDAQTEAEAAEVKWRNFYNVLKTVDSTDPTVRVSAPGLAGLLGVTREYKGLLDGIPKEVRTRFVASVQGNNVIEEFGGRGGKTPARSTTNTYIHNGNIVSNTPEDYARDRRRRARQLSNGGLP